MEVLAIIPARGGSKAIPYKNIKPLNGKPLIYYSIEAAKHSKYITRTVLSTEDKKIKEIANSLGCEVIDRPIELAQDTTKTAPVLLQVVDYLEKNENYKPDVVILLQATCPTRDTKQIDDAFKLFLSDKNCDSVFGVFDSGKTHALWRENLDGSLTGLYDYRNRPRRQDEDKHMRLLCETGSVYIIKTNVMKEVQDFIGKTPKPFIIKNSVDIDTSDDFKKVEEILI